MFQYLFYLFLIMGITVCFWSPVLPSIKDGLVAVSLFVICCFIHGFGQHLFIRRVLMLVAVFLVGISWTAWRSELRLVERLSAETEGQAVTIIGTVRDLPKASDLGTRMRVDVEQVLTSSAVVPSSLLLSDYYRRTWPAGSRWKITVRLKRPLSIFNPAGFDSEKWYWSEGIGAVGSIKKGQERLSDARDFLSYVDRFRQRLLQRIERVGKHRPRAVALISALTVGAQSKISETDWQLFRATGLIHLVSISGVHVTLLASLVAWVVAFILRCYPTHRISPRVLIACSGLIAAVCYALIAGWSVPTQRTLYMLTVAVVMLVSKRKLPPFQVWLTALTIVLVIDPFAVLTPGLWLSFGLVVVLIFATSCRRQRPTRCLVVWQGQWAVTIVSIVLLTLFFGALPLFSPVFNLVAIPLISVVITPLALFSLLCPWDFALALCLWIADYSLTLLDLVTPYAQVSYFPSIPWTIWAVAGCGALWLIAPRGLNGRICGLLLLLPLLLYQSTSPRHGMAEVLMIDVGQGLSLLVRTTHHVLLFDTGYGAAQRVLLPQLHSKGIRTLDKVIVSHHDSDHDGALSTLLPVMPVRVLMAGQPETVLNLRSNVQGCQQGQTWVWDGVRFDILAPEKNTVFQTDNAASCVLRIATKRQAMIITGDLPASGEVALVKRYGYKLRSDIVVVGHHGSKTSTSSLWLATVRPTDALISVGYRNRYRHPNHNVLNRLVDNEVNIWRTDYDGALSFTLGNPIDIQPHRHTMLPFWRIQPEWEPF